MRIRKGDLRYKGIFSLTILVMGMTISAQRLGCTDPKALNYSSQATMNDGSCRYNVTVKKPRDICTIAPDLHETSGIQYINGRFFSHNDSGNEEILWEIDTLLCQTRSKFILPINLSDWEDIAYDGKVFYLGDFGNNSGSRLDLKITVIDTLGQRQGDIWFTYPDQRKFSWSQAGHPFDCEAMIFMRDSLHLFTKDRLHKKTRHYRLPAIPGTYEAELLDSLDINGLITGADINDRGTIALLGYRETGEIFQLLLFDYPGARVFRGHKREILLGPAFQVGQAEGICFANTHDVFYTRESAFGLNARILGSNIREYTDHITPTRTISETHKIVIGPSWIKIDVNVQSTFRIYNCTGTVVLPESVLTKTTYLSTDILPSGVYHAVLISKGKPVVARSFIRS